MWLQAAQEHGDTGGNVLSYTARATGQATRLGAMASRAKGAQPALVVKKPHASAEDLRDAGPVPGSGRAPGGRHGCPRQDSCLGNPLDRGAWWAAVRGVAKTPLTVTDVTWHHAHTCQAALCASVSLAQMKQFRHQVASKSSLLVKTSVSWKREIIWGMG